MAQNIAMIAGLIAKLLIGKLIGPKPVYIDGSATFRRQYQIPFICIAVILYAIIINAEVKITTMPSRPVVISHCLGRKHLRR